MKMSGKRSGKRQEPSIEWPTVCKPTSSARPIISDDPVPAARQMPPVSCWRNSDGRTPIMSGTT